MSKNKTLTAAKNAKKDEFYTQYADIAREMEAYLDYDADAFRGKSVLLPCDDPEWSNFTKFFAENFERLGLKKLVSTSFAFESKVGRGVLDAPRSVGSRVPRDRSVHSRGASGTPRPTDLYQPTLFEMNSPAYDETKTRSHGKIFVLDEDTNRSGRIDIEDLKWEYLKGDGDFRSAEVRKLRDEADVIVTNPPFSLFREFVAWILEGEGFNAKCAVARDARPYQDAANAVGSRVPRDRDDTVGSRVPRDRPPKKFALIGNQNAIKYKEIFPLIRQGKMWLGATGFSKDMVFAVPKGTVVPEAYKQKAERLGFVGDFTRLGNTCWFSNIDHGRRHTPLNLLTMRENVKYSKHKEIKGGGYRTYVNYDAIEVPYSDAIPSDYDGVMGVPITFLDKLCPEQFEILGSSLELAKPMAAFAADGTYQAGGPCLYLEEANGPYRYRRLYDRLLIRRRNP